MAIYGSLSQAAKALPGAFRSAKGILGNNRGDWSKAQKKPSIKWDQNSQRWRDTATGQYTKGPKMPKGFGKPSTWIEGSKDVTNEMISTKEGQKVYEKMRGSSIQDDIVGAFEHVLKDLLKKK